MPSVYLICFSKRQDTCAKVCTSEPGTERWSSTTLAKRSHSSKPIQAQASKSALSTHPIHHVKPAKVCSSASAGCKASCLHDPPALERYISEGRYGDGLGRGDRDAYSKGTAGMMQYLGDWDRAWDRLAKDCDEK